MYIHFTFENGSNPYIAKTKKGLWHMIRKYCLEQISGKAFNVLGEAQILTIRPLTKREKDQAALRNFAIEWQYNFANMHYSWQDLLDYQSFFEEYGRKLGMIRELKENGII